MDSDAGGIQGRLINNLNHGKVYLIFGNDDNGKWKSLVSTHSVTLVAGSLGCFLAMSIFSNASALAVARICWSILETTLQRLTT